MQVPSAFGKECDEEADRRLFAIDKTLKFNHRRKGRKGDDHFDGISLFNHFEGIDLLGFVKRLELYFIEC